jgi:hypothetical protein
MAPTTLSTVPSGLAAARSRISFATWFPLTVYAVARLVDVVFIMIAARHQIDLPVGDNVYGSVTSNNWDGQWYSRIADNGYPSTIPRDVNGHAIQNEWGFYPVYPFFVGAIMRISGLGFTVVAPVLSTLLGAAAVTVMFRLVSQVAGRFAACATVLLTCTYMAAPAMQIAYTDSMGLLLVCSALLLLVNRQYGWLVPVLVTLALTRAVALAFVPVLVVHGLSRYRARAVDPFPIRDRWRLAALAGLAVAVTGLWPTIAALTTGDLKAYTETMSAWGKTGQLPVLIEFPAFAWVYGGVPGVAGLLAIIALIATIALHRGARAWGPEVRAWAGFYPLYLLLATAPGSSNVRHLLLAFPLMWPFPDEAISASDRRRRAALVAVLAIFGLLAQWIWISEFLVVSGPAKGRPFP